MKFTKISSTLTNDNQSVWLSIKGKMDDNSVAIDIRSDSYATQSYATIKLLDKSTGKWERVHSIPGGCMGTEIGLIYSALGQKYKHCATPELTKKLEALFEKDVKELKRVFTALMV